MTEASKNEKVKRMKLFVGSKCRGRARRLEMRKRIPNPPSGINLKVMIFNHSKTTQGKEL